MRECSICGRETSTFKKSKSEMRRFLFVRNVILELKWIKLRLKKRKPRKNILNEEARTLRLHACSRTV